MTGTNNNYIFNIHKSICLIIFLALTSTSYSQIGGGFGKFGGGGSGSSQESEYTKIAKGNPKDYLVISFDRDTTYIDTTLTLQKYYALNELKKDEFELLQFANIAEPYAQLAYNFDKLSLYNDIGVRAKYQNYINLEDVEYYRVPTASTELTYQAGFEQGQYLNVLFTANLSPRFNFMIDNKNTHSIGQYRQSIASHNNFKSSFTYESENGKWSTRGAYISQTLENQESGGLDDQALTYFITKEPSVDKRDRLDVRLKGASSILGGKTYFIENEYDIVSEVYKAKDSTYTPNIFRPNITIGHQYYSENKYYKYNEDITHNDIFGESYISTTQDSLTHNQKYNKLYIKLKSDFIGDIKAEYQEVKSSLVQVDTEQESANKPTKKLQYNATAIGLSWSKSFDNISIKADVSKFIKGIMDSYYQTLEAVTKFKGVNIRVKVNINEKSPKLNTLLYQSNYKNYNWENNFANQTDKNIKLVADYKGYKIEASYSELENYIYFKDISETDEEFVSPFQYDNKIKYAKGTISKEFKYRKFGFDNRITYQKVMEGDRVFKVPELITRTTLYFSSYVFKGKPMYLQTGVTMKYHSLYTPDLYNPLLNEFYVQKESYLGNFRTYDLFLNAEVRRTRFYIKYENFTSKWAQANYFTTKRYPGRDSVVRFGFVWNFFN